MPNRNYVKGRKKEYKIRKRLLEEGWDIAQRTAGSHSPIDVIAFHKQRKKILLVQSKPEDFGKKRTDDIKRQNAWLNGLFEVEFVVE